MRPRRNRNPTRQPQPSQLTVLLDAVALRLVALGTVQVDPGPYLAAARVLVTTAQGCGWEASTTDLDLLERHLAMRRWTWCWLGTDLVLTLPLWVQPPVRFLAIQGGLFD